MISTYFAKSIHLINMRKRVVFFSSTLTRIVSLMLPQTTSALALNFILESSWNAKRYGVASHET